jgi:two-component system, OmpR family, KDP operon response regulator KdpE
VARVLAVDDEPQVLAALARGLARAGHEVVPCRNAEEGLTAAAAQRPDVVLLDLLLPDLDGIEVVERLRTWSAVPILLLSGAATVTARVAALDAGADDVVAKPFSMEELRARVGAALRRPDVATAPGRASPAGATSPIVCEELTVDVSERRLHVRGEPVRLTPTQWRLLETLIRRPGQLLTYRQVIDEVWDASHGDEVRDALRVHLRALRGKLDDDAASPRFIATEVGLGYRWIGEFAP